MWCLQTDEETRLHKHHIFGWRVARVPLPFGKCTLQFGNVCSANKTGLVVLHITLHFILELMKCVKMIQLCKYVFQLVYAKQRSCTDYKLVNLMKLSNIKFKENPFSWRQTMRKEVNMCTFAPPIPKWPPKTTAHFYPSPPPPTSSLSVLDHRQSGGEVWHHRHQHNGRSDQTPHCSHNSY
jgi:hypothetical protein